jgi:hypothetical protein
VCCLSQWWRPPLLFHIIILCMCPTNIKELKALIHFNDFQLRCGAVPIMMVVTSFNVSVYTFVCVPTNTKLSKGY